MSCCENSPSPSSSETKQSTSPGQKEGSQPQGVLASLSPVFFALLHSSCCWLPILLDFLSIGTASVSIFERLRPAFLLFTLLTLGWSVYRNGFDKTQISRRGTQELPLRERPTQKTKIPTDTLANMSFCVVLPTRLLWTGQLPRVASGLTSSMLLETVLLRLGRDQLSWKAAAKTAAGMSLVSMLGMETVQNLVDYHLTSGVVAFDDPSFWLAAAASAGAGFLAPLPYNYTRLRKYGKACH
ncbi:hypothetical protein H105_08469 [Trichophyton soudanense CBS 452.61]|uniref:DUF4396 domain-containing protein n=1 Tax=Trichophyton soudanense CBS 452.61 TaxID=1215331 RepID=A0A022XFA7_TRISD|nr:hypothetical protein H105_08469 [Trichophyton soudanense CBS 452.61]